MWMNYPFDMAGDGTAFFLPECVAGLICATLSSAGVGATFKAGFSDVDHFSAGVSEFCAF